MHRLDAKHSGGGRGLVSIRATIQDETFKLQEYVRKMVPMDVVVSGGETIAWDVPNLQQNQNLEQGKQQEPRQHIDTKLQTNL